MSNLSQLVYEMLFEFVEEMSPDYEMCVDFLESQDIGINEEVQDVILDLLYPDCDWFSNQIIPFLRLIFLGVHPLNVFYFTLWFSHQLLQIRPSLSLILGNKYSSLIRHLLQVSFQEKVTLGLQKNGVLQLPDTSISICRGWKQRKLLKKPLIIFPTCDWLSNQIIPLLRLIFLGIHPLNVFYFTQWLILTFKP